MKSGDHEVEMNSTTLRTKVLNDKSSNIYKITKHFHSKSVSVPRGVSAVAEHRTGSLPSTAQGQPPAMCHHSVVKGCPRDVTGEDGEL